MAAGAVVCCGAGGTCGGARLPRPDIHPGHGRLGRRGSPSSRRRGAAAASRPPFAAHSRNHLAPVRSPAPHMPHAHPIPPPASASPPIPTFLPPCADGDRDGPEPLRGGAALGAAAEHPEAHIHRARHLPARRDPAAPYHRARTQMSCYDQAVLDSYAEFIVRAGQACELEVSGRCAPSPAGCRRPCPELGGTQGAAAHPDQAVHGAQVTAHLQAAPLAVRDPDAPPAGAGARYFRPHCRGLLRLRPAAHPSGARRETGAPDGASALGRARASERRSPPRPRRSRRLQGCWTSRRSRIACHGCSLCPCLTRWSSSAPLQELSVRSSSTMPRRATVPCWRWSTQWPGRSASTS